MSWEFLRKDIPKFKSEDLKKKKIKICRPTLEEEIYKCRETLRYEREEEIEKNHPLRGD